MNVEFKSSFLKDLKNIKDKNSFIAHSSRYFIGRTS